MEEKLTVDPKDAQDNKIMGILAYFGILVLVPILAAKESPFARFHANQGVILCILWIILFIVREVLWRISWTLGSLCGLLYFAIFVFAIIGIINAAKGEVKELPLIGSFKILK